MEVSRPAYLLGGSRCHDRIKSGFLLARSVGIAMVCPSLMEILNPVKLKKPSEDSLAALLSLE